MKVLFVMEDSIPVDNGCPVRNRYLMENLRQLGVDVVGVTSPFMQIRDGFATRGWETINGIRYYRTQYLNNIRDVKNPAQRWFKRLGIFSRYCEVIEQVCREERPDLIHAITSYVNGNAANRVGRRLGIPRMYEVRSMAGSAAAVVDGKSYSSFKYQTVWKLDRRAMLGATLVAPLSHALAEELVRRGVSSERMEVVHNAIDTVHFTPQQRSTELAARYGLNDGVVVGYIGSIRNIEGLSIVVNAAPDVLRQCPTAKFLIVGGGADLDNLKARAQQLGVADRFVFTGRVPHESILQYYSIIDVFVIPRVNALVNQTVAPLKPLEAMAMERAVLASDVGGLKEAIQDGKTGRLFRADDVSDFGAKLTALIADERQRRTLGAAAREWILANRQWKPMADRVVTLYDKVLRLHSGGVVGDRRDVVARAS